MTQLLNSDEVTSAAWHIWTCNKWVTQGRWSYAKQNKKTSIISGHIFSWFILSQPHPLTHWCKACCWTTPSIGIWTMVWTQTWTHSDLMALTESLPLSFYQLLKTISVNITVRENNGNHTKPIWLTTHVNALVRAVFAVRFSIAVPPLGDTLAVAADKVLFLACLPHCNGDRIKIKVSRAFNSSAWLKSKICEENGKTTSSAKDFTSYAKAMSQNMSSVLLYCTKTLISG